ncbi:unnamed protein product [Dimorphilus gyrociliatus]|uniref:Uncharacterized protein n=1 Tax=Dimorphilus gyrociliatus TaxID=2664684 RepID=A0A7I8V8W6_9ANNE|nr:unnamed protein product [Dimorphilus gyrociliatus]
MPRLAKLSNIVILFVFCCFAQIIYQTAFSFFKDWSINFEVKIVRRKTTVSPMGNLQDNTNYREMVSTLSNVKSTVQLMDLVEESTFVPFRPEFDYVGRWHNFHDRRFFGRFQLRRALRNRNTKYEHFILKKKVEKREQADRWIVKSRPQKKRDKIVKEKRLLQKSDTYKNDPIVNVVYIRVHKCASLTLANIFRRFCIEHNLSCGIPYPSKFTLGWPHLFRQEFVRPMKKKSNVISEHMVYNSEELESLMPNDTVYIASIRKPFDQFVSMFNHEKFYKTVGLHWSNAVSVYMNQLHYYSNLFMSPIPYVRRNRYACLDDGFNVGINLIINN